MTYPVMKGNGPFNDSITTPGAKLHIDSGEYKQGSAIGPVVK